MKNLLYFSLIALLFVSCSDDDEAEIEASLSVPSTYSFDNVSFNEQTVRLNMLVEMQNYMRTANSGAQIEANKLSAMYSNENAAAFEGNFDRSIQLKNKTVSLEQSFFESLFVELEDNSTSTVMGALGQAGTIESANGSKRYLFNENGVEVSQIIEMGLMSACFYYQATAVHMGSALLEADNEVVTGGFGTKMEHQWDQAFGYYGVPKTFPNSTEGLLFWGEYSNVIDRNLGTNKLLMDALLKGRAAISAKNMAIRDEAIEEARAGWELIALGAGIHYINSAMENFEDDALRNHALSKAIGFTYGLKFNPESSLSELNINQALSKMAGGITLEDMNLYEVQNEQLKEARDILAKIRISEEVKIEL